ncbi:MAG: MotA/TolQ/ExbB proton channel family protein [Sumerlaeia bacterium]
MPPIILNELTIFFIILLGSLAFFHAVWLIFILSLDKKLCFFLDPSESREKSKDGKRNKVLQPEIENGGDFSDAYIKKYVPKIILSNALIPIYTYLGILGTVLGLIMIGGGEELEEGLATALYTTAIGLVLSMFFRVVCAHVNKNAERFRTWYQDFIGESNRQDMEKKLRKEGWRKEDESTERRPDEPQQRSSSTSQDSGLGDRHSKNVAEGVK